MVSFESVGQPAMDRFGSPGPSAGEVASSGFRMRRFSKGFNTALLRRRARWLGMRLISGVRGNTGGWGSGEILHPRCYHQDILFRWMLSVH